MVKIGSALSAIADVLSALMLAAALSTMLAAAIGDRAPGPVWRDPRDPPALHREAPPIAVRVVEV